MRREYKVVAVKYSYPQSNGVVTLAEVGGSGVAELPIPAAQIKAYHIGRRVLLISTPR